MNKEVKDFALWIPTVYEPCREHDWKYRYPKNTEEMTKCFTVEEVYEDYKKKMVVS